MHGEFLILSILILRAWVQGFSLLFYIISRRMQRIDGHSTWISCENPYRGDTCVEKSSWRNILTHQLVEINAAGENVRIITLVIKESG